MTEATPKQRPQRPLLLFNHNPKAAGGSILELLRQFKPNEIVIKGHQGLTAEVRQQLRNMSHNKKNENHHVVVNTTLVHVREESCTKSMDRDLGFVLGSVREPCSQYLSLWIFGSQGRGGFYHQHQDKLGSLYGRDDPPFFNSTTDIRRFEQWLENDIVHGYVTKRFRHSYGTELEGVDCLVVVENFAQSLLYCLQIYEAQGGYVNWAAPLLAAVVNRHRNQTRHLQQTTETAQSTIVTKNNALQSPQPFHHAPCESYFSAETAKWIETGPDAYSYSLMGYQGCCSKMFHEDNDAFAASSVVTMPAAGSPPLDQSTASQRVGLQLSPTMLLWGLIVLFLLSSASLVIVLRRLWKNSLSSETCTRTSQKLLDTDEFEPLRSSTTSGNDDDGPEAEECIRP